MLGLRSRVVAATLMGAILVSAPAFAQVAIPAPPTPVETGAPSISTDAQELESFADGLLGGLIEARQVPGAVLVVVKDQSIVFARGYGFADVESRRPIDPERTLFRVASVSKLFTATAAMQMVEEGKLRLDADVNTYLDTFELPGTFAEPVTLHHLMTHTGGFDNPYLDTAAMLESPEIPLGRFLAETMPPRVLPPGQVIIYSNASWTLTGYLVERAAGKPFAEYVQERIFEPLGMTRSRWGVGRPPAADLATPYREGGAAGLVRTGFDRIHMAPAADLVTSGTDIARFMLAHLNRGALDGNVILHPDTIDRMHAQHFANAPGLDGWAYGFREQRRNGWRAIAHDGGWNGFGSILMLVPEAKMGFFVSINKTRDDIFFEALVQNMFDHLFPPRDSFAPPAPSLEQPSPSAEEIAGTYISAWRIRSDYMKLGQLPREDQITAVSPMKLRHSAGGRPREFTYAGNGVWREQGSGQRHLMIVARENGEVVRVAIDELAIDRAAWFETATFTMRLALIAVILALGSLAAWGVHGPLILRRTHATVSATPLPLRVSVLGCSALVLMLFVIVGVALSSPASLLDLIMQPPFSYRLASWIPILLAALAVPFAYFLVRAVATGREGRLQPSLALLPFLTVLITLWFAWFWNLHPFAF